jgi:hypothetical protein
MEFQSAVHGAGIVMLFRKFLGAMVGLLIKLPIDRRAWGEKLRRACADLDSEPGKKFRTHSFVSFDEVDR